MKLRITKKNYNGGIASAELHFFKSCGIAIADLKKRLRVPTSGGAKFVLTFQVLLYFPGEDPDTKVEHGNGSGSSKMSWIHSDLDPEHI